MNKKEKEKTQDMLAELLNQIQQMEADRDSY
jgi:hemerythrin superfamily protein